MTTVNVYALLLRIHIHIMSRKKTTAHEYDVFNFNIPRFFVLFCFFFVLFFFCHVTKENQSNAFNCVLKLPKDLGLNIIYDLDDKASVILNEVNSIRDLYYVPGTVHYSQNLSLVVFRTKVFSRSGNSEMT